MSPFQSLFLVPVSMLLVSNFFSSEVAGQSCSKSDNKDVSGPNLKEIHNTPEHKCCGLCKKTPNCRAYAWNDYLGGTCWLKESTQLFNKDGVKAGVLSGTDPDPADGKCAKHDNQDVSGANLAEINNQPETACCEICRQRSGCRAYAWNNYKGGTCWLKTSTALFGKTGVKAGILSGVPGDDDDDDDDKKGGTLVSVSGVKGTMWADQTDPGGCSMPQADYNVHDAVALGDQSQLGGLKHKHALCGQVLKINCGGQEVEAVVASTCNIRSGTCGVDMIRRTWNQATGNKQPGIVTCTVGLSSRRPMNGNSPLCFIRPDAIPGISAFFTSAGVFNTGGKLVASATLAGAQGAHNGDSGYFDFSSGGSFTPDATLTVRFEDGSSHNVRYGECMKNGVKIWRS